MLWYKSDVMTSKILYLFHKVGKYGCVAYALCSVPGAQYVFTPLSTSLYAAMYTLTGTHACRGLRPLQFFTLKNLNRQRMHQPQNISSWMSYQCTVSVCECAVRKVRLHSNLTYMHMWFTYHPTPLCTHQCHFIKAPSYPPGHGVIHDVWEVHSPI